MSLLLRAGSCGCFVVVLLERGTGGALEDHSDCDRLVADGSKPVAVTTYMSGATVSAIGKTIEMGVRMTAPKHGRRASPPL